MIQRREAVLLVKTFIEFDADQSFLLAKNPRDWIPRDHFVFFIEDTVQKLDLSAIYASYKDGVGAPPYDPRMMTSILIYGYSRGIRSSRKLERACVEDMTFRVLAAQNQPDHSRISAFRKRHLAALEGLFTQVLVLCHEEGIVKLQHVAIDGTKVRANASKRKSMTLIRLTQEREKIKKEVQRWLKEAEEIDEKEDAEQGDERAEYKMPPELADKKTRLKRIEDALKRLKEREQKDIDENPARRDKKPRDKAQYNFVDPDSRIMPDGADKTTFVQAYNMQAAVDSHRQIIVAYTIAQNPIDNPQLPNVIATIENNLDKLPEEISADAGYGSDANLNLLDDLGVDAFVSTTKHKRDLITHDAPKGRIPRGMTLRDRMARKLKTKRGHERYALRKQIVEPVFGQMKEARGFRRFLLRGVEKARGAWSLACTVHNPLKLFGHQKRSAG